MSSSYHALIQFRSDLLAQWIAEYATIWNVNDNEAAKRLAALAAVNLDVDQYPVLLSLSEVLSGPYATKPSFVRACEQVKIAVEAANRARQEMGKKHLVNEERAKFITKTIEETLAGKKEPTRKAQTKSEPKAK